MNDLIPVTLAEHQADDLRLEAAPKEIIPLSGIELDLTTENLSDEEMDKSSRRTSLSQRVQGTKFVHNPLYQSILSEIDTFIGRYRL